MAEFGLGSAFVTLGVNGFGNLKAGLGKALGMVSSTLGTGLAVGGAAIVGGIAATAALAVSAFAESQAAESALRSALKNTGQEVDGNIARFQELAEKLQSVTTQDDEATLGLITTATNLGLTASQAENFTKAAVGLAKVTGTDAASALEGLIKSANGMKSPLDKMLPQLQGCANQQERMAMLSKLASEGMDQQFDAANTLAGQWEHLKQTCGNFLELLGGNFDEIGAGVISQLTSFVEWIANLTAAAIEFGIQGNDSFGKTGGSVNSMGTMFSSVFGTIKQVIKDVVFTFLNWDLVTKSAGITLAQFGVHAYERFKNLWDNIGIGIDWFSKHWREVFTDVGNFTTTLFSNIASNIGLAVKKAWAYVNGDVQPTEAFKGLTDGFKSAITDDPKWKELKLSDFSDQFKELDKEWAKRAEKWGEISKDKAPKALDPIKEEMKKIDLEIIKPKDEKKKKEKEDKSSFKGVTETWKDLQMDLFKDKNKTPEQQLKTQKDIAKHGKMQVEKLDQLIKKQPMVAS